MYQKSGRRIIFIIFITLVALFISLPTSINPGIHTTVFGKKVDMTFDLKLGLDLVGGSHLVFEADTKSIADDKKANAMAGLKEIIERRVNLFGVSEPSVQTSSFEGRDRIIVELPGITDTKEAIALVGKTAQLVFAELDAEAKELKNTDLTGADLKQADVSFDQVSGKPVVLLEFSSEGALKFEKITERNIGKPLAMLLDGQLLSNPPVVQEKIIGGKAEIRGDYTIEQAKKIAIQLNSGALPVSISLTQEQSVGASLGRDSIDKSIRAGVVGLALVSVFMVIMYGRLGLIADVGLIIFALLTFSLYKLIPVVLTLPGIAGFLLSVGMAVDSNILIFERFREDKKKGINTQYALESSFGRAWDSIRDANIATLTTAFILANPLDWSFLHTSGPVRGFAITLALGIVVSMFTGIFVSRNLLRFFIRK